MAHSVQEYVIQMSETKNLVGRPLVGLLKSDFLVLEQYKQRKLLPLLLLCLLPLRASATTPRRPSPRISTQRPDAASRRHGPKHLTKPRQRRHHRRVRGLRGVHWRSLVYRLRIPNLRYRRSLAREIKRRGEVRALPYLLGMLRKHKQPEKQIGALVALGELGVLWSFSEVIKHLSSPQIQVRVAVLRALGQLCQQRRCRQHRPAFHKQAVQALFRAITHGKPAEVRIALWSLASLEDPMTLPRLQKLYQTPTRKPGTGLWYSRALATLGDPTKRQKWKGLFQQRRRWVFIRMAHWPGRWVSRLLAEGLKAKKPKMRRFAAKMMLRRLDPMRAYALTQSCRTHQLPPRLCERIRQQIQASARGFPAVPPPLYLLTPAQARAIHARIHRQTPNFDTRLVRISDRMLGTAYLLDPLGEGKHGRYDRDPLFSLQRVDCVTFVEQVIAMARIPTFSGAIQYAQKIRYIGGKVDYRNRRHLPIAQWIPAMIRLGVGRDITREVGGDKTRIVVKKLTRRSYSTREGQRLWKRLGKERVVLGEFRLPYLPLEVALAKLKKIPSGVVLSSLRAANPYSPGQVTHQGLVIRKEGELYMRHASSLWGSVVDVPLYIYLRSLLHYPRKRIGVHLLKLLPPKR